MSRKSLVRERCDVFENDCPKSSSVKSHNFQGKQHRVENHQTDVLNNKRPSCNRSNSRIKSISNIQTIHNRNDEHQSTNSDFETNLGTVRDRISKLNLEVPDSHNTNTSRRFSTHRKSISESNISSTTSTNNDYFKHGKNETSDVHFKGLHSSNASSGAFEKRYNGSLYSTISTNTNIMKNEKEDNNGVHSKNWRNGNSSSRISLSSNSVRDSIEKKVGKLDLSSYEKVISENQNNVSTLTYRRSKSNNEESTMKDVQPSDDTNTIELEVSNLNVVFKNKPPRPRKRLPKIPTKPKYINKIKANPNMSSDSKQQLQEKIRIFNELSKQGTNTEDKRSNLVLNTNIEDVSKINEGDQVEYETVESFHEINKTDDSSEESSDDDMATEYDIIENLNVTKITVERRYNVPDHEEECSTFNVKRETYYDHNLNPRIEHISRNLGIQEEKREHDMSQGFSKSSFIIQELLQTELVYYKGLLHVYENYITYFRKDLNAFPPNISKVFGNFEEIYKQQSQFYGELTECHNDVEALAETFLRNEKIFTLYEKYIINKHVSTKYMAEECSEEIKARDQELGQKLNLASYLLTPVQRLFRYLLLLKSLREALIKEKRECTKLDTAIDYLEKLIESTNTHARVIQRIQDSPIDFSRRGKYLLSDDFTLKNNRKKYSSTVILLEDLIIFTQKVDDETYIYKACINLSDLYVRSITEDLTSFQLQNFTKYKLKPDNKYVFDLEVTDANIKNEWVKKIESLLWNQFAAHKRC